ncbi:MAG: hypothetical protein ACRCV6_00465 [Formosimonas sp.]
MKAFNIKPEPLRKKIKHLTQSITTGKNKAGDSYEWGNILDKWTIINIDTSENATLNPKHRVEVHHPYDMPKGTSIPAALAWFHPALMAIACFKYCLDSSHPDDLRHIANQAGGEFMADWATKKRIKDEWVSFEKSRATNTKQDADIINAILDNKRRCDIADEYGVDVKKITGLKRWIESMKEVKTLRFWTGGEKEK